MLRCRKCRKCIIDPTSLSVVDNMDESSAAVCNIWHVNVDTLPGWILTSIHQAQWTVGKLNCQYCSSRLGSFNFVNRSECPCGRDATVHLNKSRVDLDHRQNVLIFQPRRTRPRMDQAGSLTDVSGDKDQSPETNGTEQDNSHAMSNSSPVAASNTRINYENNQFFSFSPLYCISHRRRRSMEDVTTISSSCFCPAGTTGSTWPSVSYSTSQQCDTDGEASVNTVACLAFVSRRARPPSHQQLLETAEDTLSSLETPAFNQAHSDSVLPPGGGPISDSVAEQNEEVTAETFTGTQTSNRLNKREKNRLKGLRRKQRRRERWLLNQPEPEKVMEDTNCRKSSAKMSGKVANAQGSLLDSTKEKEEEEEEEEEYDGEGLTCAVCLDIYFSPYSCQPCGHIFCEPCLRTVAKNRATNTPCPLCRTLISHTNFEEELDRTAKAVFPKVYCARKQTFLGALCAKWPLPHCRKHYSTFWGEQRQALRGGRRWHFVHGGFTLNALDLTDMRVWLFDICLLILYIHSCNWILSLLFLGVIFYFFFF